MCFGNNSILVYTFYMEGYPIKNEIVPEIKEISNEDMYDLVFPKLPNGLRIYNPHFKNIHYLHSPEVARLSLGVDSYPSPAAEEAVCIGVGAESSLIGVASLFPDQYRDNTLDLRFVSVHSGYRNRGIGSLLARYIFEYCLIRGKNLQLSTFTDLGKKYIEPVFVKLAEEYGSKGVVTYYSIF